MQGEPLITLAHHVDLATGDRSVAQNADPFIIERIPFAALIGRLQDREFFFGREV